MTQEIGSEQILGYLKGKYLAKNSTTKPSTNDVSKKEGKIPAGEESDLTGEEAENKFLKSKLQSIQVELTKWLEVLKNKL